MLKRTIFLSLFAFLLLGCQESENKKITYLPDTIQLMSNFLT